MFTATMGVLWSSWTMTASHCPEQTLHRGFRGWKSALRREIVTIADENEELRPAGKMTAVIGDTQRAEHQARHWAASVLVLAFFMWMAIVWWHFGRTIIRFYSPLPYFDYWNTVTKIDRLSAPAYRRSVAAA